MVSIGLFAQYFQRLFNQDHTQNPEKLPDNNQVQEQSKGNASNGNAEPPNNKNDSNNNNNNSNNKSNNNNKTNKPDFPNDPNDFKPENTTKKTYKDGEIIKWHDSESGKSKFEWHHDPKYGDHYHMNTEDGKGHIPDPDTGDTHFYTKKK